MQKYIKFLHTPSPAATMASLIITFLSLIVQQETQGALDPKLARHVRRAKKITGPLLVQTSQEILGKLTLISANFSSN